MDALSDLLRSVRLKGGIFLEARMTAPWSIYSQVTEEECRPFFDRPSRIISYHYIVSGEMQVGVVDGPLAPVRAGEIVMLPRNETHVMASAAGLPPVRTDAFIEAGERGSTARLVMGGGGALTQIVCGFLATDEVYNPLIEALPSMLTVDVRECATREWIDASMRFAAAEMMHGRRASSEIVSRLSELLFAEGIRQYLETREADDAIWLKGLRDPQVGKALALMHRDMTVSWSAEELAAEVAMSRSAFMDRFTTLVGIPPIRYLTQWRLRTARHRLREQHISVGQLAHDVGYESEEAFSRAFKREFGVSPGRWRDEPDAAAVA
ncbi:MAG: AraC family transcriptional regulator [Bauldia sp.]|nr:AraC family transcriptional regulator [Bauldia sp.]MCW5716631.1 AraC family transcriptional regulator [Bauldia sp.]